MSPARPRVLVVSMARYEHATRPRKAALQYAAHGRVRFVSLQGVGRTGKWGQAGRSTLDDIEVEQVRVRSVRTDPTRMAVVRNLLVCYLPAMLRLARRVLLTRADVVHVTGAPLSLLGVLHKLVHRSRLVLDVNERPGSTGGRGSVFGVAMSLEPVLLRLAARHQDVTTVVTDGHADALRTAYGFDDVLVVRNGPLRSWLAPWAPPPAETGPFRVVTVGTLFENRGFELLIEAVGLVGDRAHLQVDVHGRGRPDYVEGLQRLVEERGLGDRVRLHGPIPSDEVCLAYQGGHAGLALYEAQESVNDSLSNKLCEVICAGRPVIAGDLPENRRFVENTGTGWLTDVTAADLADALVRASRSTGVPGLAAHCHEVGQRVLIWETAFAPVLERAGLRAPR